MNRDFAFDRLCKTCADCRLLAGVRNPLPTLAEIIERCNAVFAERLEREREPEKTAERIAVVSGVVLTQLDRIELERRRAKLRGVT